MSELYFVFDVESLGLHGTGFAYGFVVVDAQGNEQGSGYAAFKVPTSDCPEFVNNNVLPALWGFTHEVKDADKEAGESQWTNQREAWSDFRDSFWNKWLEWKEKGAVMVSDCAWPVEANFLSRCVADDPEVRGFGGPYPLLDVSSILLAAGKDPVGTFERKVGELPAHNPLCDARQSARVLIETLRELRDTQAEVHLIPAKPPDAP